jgi:hypothetical protein
MEIKGKVHCFFEQSGTFKQEFQKLGIPAEDYDIQNNFGETDHVIDLFAEIESAYDSKPSVFDNITREDLIMAFFPCIYFSAISQMSMSFGATNYRKLSIKEKTDKILERSENREHFFRICVKMISVAMQRGVRLIMENPWSEQTFLKANFVMPPSLVDMDRTKRGDVYKKPTAYWFVNCEHTNGQSFQRPKTQVKTIMSSRSSSQAGICSEERSMISPDYARNFICDFILGKEQKNTQLSLFS